MPIDEAKLTEYALDILDEREFRVMQQEIAASQTLQNELAAIQNALQNVALAENPIYPSDRLRNLVLDSIQEKTRFDGFIDRFSELFDFDKLTSKLLLDKIDHDSKNDWETTLFPGIEFMKFLGGPKVASATCGIVQVKQETLFPAHQHQGDERILVLQGTARDDHAKVLTAGDTMLFSAGSRHSLRIISEETFIFAVVLQKDNKWLLLKTLIDYVRIKK